MLELIFKARWISAIAVVFSGPGAALMMIVGAVSTIDAIGIHFGSEKQEGLPRGEVTGG